MTGREFLCQDSGTTSVRYAQVGASEELCLGSDELLGQVMECIEIQVAHMPSISAYVVLLHVARTGTEDPLFLWPMP